MNIKNETPDILFKKDYYSLIESLVVDIEQIELIKSLTEKYRVKNPSFLNKLKQAANLEAFEEVTKWHTDKMINDEESSIIFDILSKSFEETVSKIGIEQAFGKVTKIEADNTEENSIIFKLPYVRLFLNVLTCFEQDKDEIEAEDPCGGLSIRERLLLLDILVSTKSLNSITLNKILLNTLPLITGIKESSLSDPLKYHYKWGEKDLTLSEYTSRHSSILNIKNRVKNKDIEKELNLFLSHINKKIRELQKK